MPSGANSQPNGSAPADAVGGCQLADLAAVVVEDAPPRRGVGLAGVLTGDEPAPVGHRADLAVDVAPVAGVVGGARHQDVLGERTGADRVDVVAAEPVALGAVEQLA